MNLKESVIGLELGSTRIKAVLIDENHNPAASGGYEWENRLENGVWTYSYEAIRGGVQACFADLMRDVREKFGIGLTAVGAIGISGMMHGYLPLDADGQPLTAFRTWRNTMTGEGSEKLTGLFDFYIPQRWSIAHLYQAILNGEEHLPRLSALTTVAVYIHYLITGKMVVGIGEASGIFPINSETLDYDKTMMDAFDALIPEEYGWRLRDVLPKVLCAGDCGGRLTKEGALFLDPTGTLQAGIPVAPPEGDAGTGMTATNSVRVNTGNVSAGTSAFAMIVVDRKLRVHREINMVTTPAGKPVAMVHCSNCTSDINAWVNLFADFAAAFGMKLGKGELYTRLFTAALEGEPDCGGLLSYNYYSGEGVTAVNEGRPVFARMPGAEMTLANFMRCHLFSALATLKIGIDILTKEERVVISKLYGHGGYFKTPGVGQRLLSAAVGAPASVMETAGEGGPYGMALLAAYMLRRQPGEALEDYLADRVFADAASSTVMADKAEIDGFAAFLAAYQRALPIEKAAIETMR